MPSEKIYAIVFSDGSNQVISSSWDKVKVIVDGVSGVRYKGFSDQALADAWVKKTIEEVKVLSRTKAAKNKIEKKYKLTKMELMSKTINTPFWNSIRKSKKRISEG